MCIHVLLSDRPLMHNGRITKFGEKRREKKVAVNHRYTLCERII